MRNHGILKYAASSDTYASLLRGCRHIGEVSLIHAHLSINGWIRKTFVANLVVQMYGALGSAGDAWHAFSTMPARNLFSWNITLGAHTRHEELEYARNLFQKMPNHDTVSWNLMFVAYAQSGNLVLARNLFDSMPWKSSVSWNSMAQAYISHGFLDEARDLFDRAPEKNVVSWNAMIQGYAEKGDLQRSRDLFHRMPLTDLISWTTIITGHVARGKIDEGRVFFEAMPERSAVAWNAMIQASCQEGDVDAAAALFTAMPPGRDCSSWTSMISGYARNDRIAAAAAVFWQMPGWSVISWNAMAMALAESGDLSSAKNLFDRIPEKNSVSWNAMIQGYTASEDLIAVTNVFDRMPQRDVISFTTLVAAIAQGGDLDRARALFDAMPERNLVSWNAMIAGYAQNGDPSSAMALLNLLDQDGLRPNAITFVVALDSCANLAALARGKLLLAEISLLQDELSHSIELGNAAINLLGKCGQLDQARQIFDSWNTRRGDAVAWNTMIAAYSQNGMGRDAMDLFAAMNLEGVEVDDVTLLSVLAAATSRDAIRFFHSIAADYRSAHSREHFLCLADALGRSGKLREALEVILAMPYAPNLIAWTTLLGACKSHADVEIGEEAAMRARELWPESSAPYIALSSIYAARLGHGRVLEYSQI